ncbi:hypothetical protein [Tsuneonella sp. HG222]
MTTLAANLALVRPAGMGSEAAEEWLTVAAGSLTDIPLDILRDAATEARKVCTHHGQIVPKIREMADQRINWRRATLPAERIPRERRIENRWTPQEGEIERIKREAAERIAAGR